MHALNQRNENMAEIATKVLPASIEAKVSTITNQEGYQYNLVKYVMEALLLHTCMIATASKTDFVDEMLQAITETALSKTFLQTVAQQTAT